MEPQISPPAPAPGAPAPPPIAPVVEPSPPAPEPAIMGDGGQTDRSFMERIFGISNGELGFTGILISAMFFVGYGYQIYYHRKKIMDSGSHIAMQKQIDELKAKIDSMS